MPTDLLPDLDDAEIASVELLPDLDDAEIASVELLPDLDDAEAFQMVMSWPSRERREIITWLNGALTGRGFELSPAASALLEAFRVRFPHLA